MGRREELRAQVEQHVSEFSIGDTIDFIKCNEYGEVVDLTGIIIKIDGWQATVEHQYGVCSTCLVTARKGQL